MKSILVFCIELEVFIPKKRKWINKFHQKKKNQNQTIKIKANKKNNLCIHKPIKNKQTNRKKRKNHVKKDIKT